MATCVRPHVLRVPHDTPRPPNGLTVTVKMAGDTSAMLRLLPPSVIPPIHTLISGVTSVAQQGVPPPGTSSIGLVFA
jgi:hypothetical protein